MTQRTPFQDSMTLDACVRTPRYRVSDVVQLEVSVLAPAAEMVETTPARSSSAMQRQPCITILVVDDEPDMRAYLKGCLRTLKGSIGPVLEAADGKAALETARQSKPNLIISDVHIPKMDGFMLCRALRADTSLRHIPVLLVSGETPRNAVQEQAREAGAVGLLDKPFNAHRLCAELERLLRPSLA